MLHAQDAHAHQNIVYTCTKLYLRAVRVMQHQTRQSPIYKYGVHAACISGICRALHAALGALASVVSLLGQRGVVLVIIIIGAFMQRRGVFVRKAIHL